MLKYYLSLFFLLFGEMAPVFADGKFINPITDVCWKCLFPIHAAGVNTTPGYKDYMSYKNPICACAGTPPKVGIPLAFWEPVALIEVVRIPYKCLTLGGKSIGTPGIKGRGGLSNVGESSRHSFYHVHYYKFPILSFLDLFPGFSCTQKQVSMDIVYMSELDPTWSDDGWNAVVNPQAILYSNPVAQSACIADCTTSSLDKPNDIQFWCAGCSGSLYPFMGHVTHHVGGVQASYLLVQRTLAKLHSLGTIWAAEQDNFCQKKPAYTLPKKNYKTQLAYPIANTKGPCQTLGKTDIVWGSGKTYPKGGEDFIYVIWGKKHCCIDAVEIALTAVGGAK